MEFLKEPIYWIREEIISCAEFIYGKDDSYIYGIKGKYAMLPDKSELYRLYRNDSTWIGVLLYISFENLPLLNPPNIFSKKALLWRLEIGK